MQYRGNNDLIVPVFVQIFLGQLLKRADGRDVLHDVAALPVADGDVAHALFGGKQRFDDGSRVRNARRHQRAGQRSVRLPIDGDPHFLVQARQTVNILPGAEDCRKYRRPHSW